MPDDSILKEPRPRRFARLRRWLLRGGLAFVVLVIALALGQRYWLPGFVRYVAPVVCERLVGFELEIDEVVSASLGHLELRGVRMRGIDPEFPVRTASARELSARFSIPGLVRDWTVGLQEVRGRELRLEIDASAPGEDDGTPAEPLPLGLPVVDLEDVQLALELPEARLELDVRRLACADGEALELTTGPVKWIEGEGGFAFRELELDARYKEARVEDLRLITDGELRLSGVAVDLSRVVLEGRLKAYGQLLTPGGGAGFNLELDPDKLALHARASGLALDRFRRFLSAPLDDLAGTLELSLDAEVSLADALDSTAEVQLEAEEFRLAGQRAALVRLGGSLSERVLHIESLEAIDGPNELRARNLQLSLADLEVDEWIRRLSGELELELVEPARLRLTLPPELEAHVLRTHVLMAATIADGEATLQQLDLVAPGIEAQLSHGRVRLDPLDAPELDVALDVSVEDLAAALAPLELEGYAGRFDGFISAQGTLTRVDELDARAVVEGEGLSVAGIDVGDLAFDAELDRDTLRVLRLVASSTLGEVDASGAYRFATKELEGCKLHARLFELERILPELARGGVVYADVEASGALNNPTAEFNVSAAALALGELPSFDAGVIGRLVGGGLVVDALRVATREDALFATGRAQLGPDWVPLSSDLLALEYRHAGRIVLALQDPVQIDLEGGGVAVSELALTGEQGKVFLDLEHSDAGSHLRLAAADFHPGAAVVRFFPDGFGLERLDLDVALDLVGEVLAVDARLRADGVRVPEVAQPFQLDASVQQGRVNQLIGAADADFGEAGRVQLSASAVVDPTRADWLAAEDVSVELDVAIEKLESLIDWSDRELRARGSLFAFVELGGALDRLEGLLWLAAEELRMSTAENPEGFGPARVEARAGFRDVIALDSLTFELGEGDTRVGLSVEGDVKTPVDARAMLTDFEEWRCAAEIDLHAFGATDDIAGAAAVLDVLDPRDLPVRAGELELDLALRGTAAEPIPRGWLALKEGVLRLGADMPSADRVDLRIELEPNVARLVRLTGELGGSTFHGSGHVDLSGPDPELDLEFYGAELLLARSRELRLRANADLIVIGSASAPTIAGLVTLVDARYYKNFELDVTRRGGPSSGAAGMQIFRFREPPLSRARFEVDIRAEQPVQVENTTLRSTLWPDLVLKGTGEVPILIGSVFLEPSYVRLPGGTLTLDSGTVQFTEANPFVPTLALNGSARMRGYDVSVVISGDVQEPEITLSSNPPLSSDALLVLLTTGQLPAESARSTAGQTATALATYLAEDIFAREFGGAPGEGDSFISRFEILTGQDISRSGAETIWVSFRMSGNDAKDRRHWHLVGERDVWDYYNYGLRITFKFR